MTEAVTESAYRDRGGLITGSLSVAVGIAVVIYASGMPEIRPGIPGPGLFPMMVGGLMVLFGVPLALFSWFRAKNVVDEDDLPPLVDEAADTGQTVGSTEGPLATSQRSALINAVSFVAAIVFYIVFAEILGFVITMGLITVGLMVLLRVKPWRAVVIGLVTTLVLWGLFEKLLLVQLPNGFLGIF